ncbi:MAG TPA: hypothetical protein VFV37_10950 [Luteibaculaceae bacterium]|nr:hypothetical protein [Luteibaculaceae bacterium]
MTERFNRAVVKLYTAFHEGTLDAMDCKHCAVGNLCDNQDSWASKSFGVIFGDYNRVPKSYKFHNPSRYSNRELVEIECIFIYGSLDRKNPIFSNIISNNYVKWGVYTKKEQKELQFKGLCAVIEHLAKLDGIPNPFNFDSLFSDDKEVAEKEISLILC